MSERPEDEELLEHLEREKDAHIRDSKGRFMDISAYGDIQLYWARGRVMSQPKVKEGVEGEYVSFAFATARVAKSYDGSGTRVLSTHFPCLSWHPFCIHYAMTMDKFDLVCVGGKIYEFQDEKKFINVYYLYPQVKYGGGRDVSSGKTDVDLRSIRKSAFGEPDNE